MMRALPFAPRLPCPVGPSRRGVGLDKQENLSSRFDGAAVMTERMTLWSGMRGKEWKSLASQWTWRGSNPLPRRCGRRALPVELQARTSHTGWDAHARGAYSLAACGRRRMRCRRPSHHGDSSPMGLSVVWKRCGASCDHNGIRPVTAAPTRRRSNRLSYIPKVPHRRIELRLTA